MSMETIKTECQAELNLVEDAKQLADFWAKYLSKNGEVQKLMSGIKNVPKEEKKAYGQAVNEIKNWAQALYDAKKEEIDTAGYVYDRVCRNPKCICQTEQELPQIFKTTDKAANIHRCIYCEKKA